ncbi:unnamed protein product [Polarella glacialis]|uniref:B box-type domain-containing protein n=1 Tax=Polarella glacialis TaxID=89957 RepID=A0A813JC30_POLGL|nr:unnamed protein product [Polarella glacialis]
MTLPTGAPANYIRGEPPTRCAECGHVLIDALVLSCGHDLCLGCAGNALRQTRSLTGRIVRCLICPSVTELCEEAAATLLGVSASGSGCSGGLAASADTSGRRAEPVTSYHSHQSQLLPQPRVALSAVIGPPVPQAVVWGPQLGLGACVACSAHGSLYPQLVGDELRGGPGSPSRSPREVREEPSSRSRPVSPWDCTSMDPGQQQEAWTGRTAHIQRCPEHPEEPATYFCATCECDCICAECVVQKNGRHRDHKVMRVGRAHEVLKSRAGALLDEAVALEDDFAMVSDRLAWRRKDIERAAVRGRASVRSAFARVRAQLNEREAELLESLDAYEGESILRLDSGHSEHSGKLHELRRLQESLRSRCRTGGDAVEALNTYSAAKRAIASLREAFRQEDFNSATPPDEFVGLAGSARAELDLHAEGLASLEEAVASLCERGVDFPTAKAPGPHSALGEPSFAPGGWRAAGGGNSSAAAGHLLSMAEPHVYREAHNLPAPTALGVEPRENQSHGFQASFQQHHLQQAQQRSSAGCFNGRMAPSYPRMSGGEVA